MSDPGFGEEIIRVVFYDDDIEGLAEELGVDLDVARQRAHSWAGPIANTLIELANEQLASVIEHDQP